MATNPYQLSETELDPTQPLQGLEELGALGTLNKEEQSTAYDIPVFQVKTYAPENLQNLQNVYGTQAMPIFEWAKKVQTGTVQYDPSSPVDQELLEQYRAAVDASGLPEGMPDPYDLSWEDVAKQTTLATVGASAPIFGANIGGALADPYLTGGVADKLLAGTKASLPFGGDLPSQVANQSLSQGYDLVKAGGIADGQVFVPELANAEVAAATGNLDTYNTLQRLGQRNQAGSVALDGSRSMYSSTPAKGQTTYSPEALKDVGIEVGADGKLTGGQNLNSTVLTSSSQAPGYFQGVGDRLYGAKAGSTWGQAGTAALINFGVNVASGMKPTDAAKAAGASGVAYAIGFALSAGNPLVASIVSTVAAKPIQKAGSKLVEETKGVLDSTGDVLGKVGSAAKKVVKAPVKAVKKVKKVVTGGRVICNELRRQGLLETKDVLLDYKFTKEHLTPQHVAGYHFWAVKVVKRLRKGKGVKLWKHIAGHRANEIAYIYGERDKPDYLGKLYRKIFEPVCWSIGLFCEETDWSVLYEDKEI